MRRAFAFAAAALVFACGEVPGKPWLVERTRVLGARVEPLADPGRASLDPGERARITWLVASPGPSTPRVAWSFAACVAPSGNYAQPRCETPALASGSGASDGSDLVAMELDTPPAAATGDASELLVVAAFCESAGSPALEPRGFTATCEGGGEALLASVRVRLAAAGPPNRHPAVADDALVLPPDCAPPGSAELTFTFRFRGEEREGGESIVLSHAVTGGELDRYYSAFEATDPAPKEVEVTWKPPAGEEVVRVFFVLRDGRGGTTFVRRTVCTRR